jgi:hypothetical protein
VITSNDTVITMTYEDGAAQHATRLFQVNLLAWSLPLMIACSSYKRAAELALCNTRGATGGIIVVDATEQFLSVSAKVRIHTCALCAAAVEGIVDYDDENGWMLRASQAPAVPCG